MKIEFGFQANCSELVTHLGCRTPVEVAAGMKKLAELTRGHWEVDLGQYAAHSQYDPEGVVELPEEETFIKLPNEALEGTLILGGGASDLRLDSKALLPKLEPLVSKKMFQALQQVSQFDIMVDLVVPGIPDKVRFEYDCWCGEDQLHFGIDSISLPEMALFHWIRSFFKADGVTHDGGNPFPYMAWLAYHYDDKEDGLEFLGDAFSDDEIEDWALKDLEENPPLPGSQPPDEDDRRFIGPFGKPEGDSGGEEEPEEYEEEEPLSPWAPQPQGRPRKKNPERQNTVLSQEKPKKKKGFFSRLFGGK